MSDAFGTLLPRLATPVPGPRSHALADRLRAVESRNVTWLADDFPVFWEEALGANVRDADGNVFVDLTAAFGVALPGHRAPEVVRAVEAQAGRLIHGMGDVHPPTVKVRLLEALASLMPWPDARTILTSSGSEAVEAALKTARLAGGRPGVVAFHGGYHGLTLGSLAATSRADFRAPVAERLYPGVVHLPFPLETTPDPVPADGESGTAEVGEVLARLDHLLDSGTPGGPVGTLIVEPVQARGGVRPLPQAFTRALAERARRHGLVIVADEIFTGLGRCGAPLASPLVGLDPDIVCVGKVLGGGMPLSACVAPARVMDAWPASDGEALHTSTFLGHPLSCAAGEAVLALVAAGLPSRAARLGEALVSALEAALADLIEAGRVALRAMGLLIGLELRDADGGPRPGAGAAVAGRMLGRGWLVLPAGETGAVLELSPPAVLTDDQVAAAVRAIEKAVREELA